MNDMSEKITYRAVGGAAKEKTEWETRVDLAAMFRLMAMHGMSNMAGNHITARVPGSHDEFLINPYGMMYEEITASSLFKIDLEGKVLAQPDLPYGINPAGYVIHSAIHRARHDVQCVVHTHTRAGVAVSCMDEGLLPLNMTAMNITDDMAYHEYEGPIVNLDEQARLVAHLGSSMNVMLRNHGLLSCGRTIAEAFYLIYQFEEACRVQVDLMASGAKLRWPSNSATHNTAEVMQHLRGAPRGEVEWASLRRTVDKVMPGYDR